MPNPNQTKGDERRNRNLASANASRQRRRDQIATLSEERTRISETNQALLTRLRISSSISSGEPASGGTATVRGIELGPSMRHLLRRGEIHGDGMATILDRHVADAKTNTRASDESDGRHRQLAESPKSGRDVSRSKQSGGKSGYRKGGSGSKPKGGTSSTKKR